MLIINKKINKKIIKIECSVQCVKDFALGIMKNCNMKIHMETNHTS